MAFSNNFRKRLQRNGSTLQERRMKKKQRTFNEFFSNTLTAQKVLINGKEETVVIQDQTQNNNKDLSDDKYVIAKKDTLIETGYMMEWRDKKWLFFSKEEKTIDTHQQFKVRPSNYTIKFINKDGSICGNGEGLPSVVQNQTLYTLGVATSGNNAWVVNAKMLIYLVDDEESRGIEIDKRLFIGNAIYRVMFKDSVSRKGIVHFLLEEEMVNANVDNIKEGIADYYKYYDENGNRLNNIESGEGQQEDIETGTTKNIKLEIDGYSDIPIGETQKYNIKVFIDDVLQENENIESLALIDDKGCIDIVEQTGNSITLYAKDNFSNIDEMVNLIAKYKDVIVSKTIGISSPY